MTPDRSKNPTSPSRWDGPTWILALCTLWIAQPLYDLLGRTPDYFWVRGLGTSDVWGFGLLAFLLPPIVLVAVTELVGLAVLAGRDRIRGKVRDVAYRALASALAAWGILLVLSVLDHSTEAVRISAVLYAAAALSTAPAFFLLLRLEGTRHALRLLALLAPLAPVLFFLRAEVRGELATSFRTPSSLQTDEDSSAASSSGEEMPVVVLVLDELPLFTLLDPRGEIDSEQFPNLAALSATATWYRGATTPRVFTQHAMPALVAGRVGGLQVPATVRGYPANLLTLLRGSHRVVSDEPITAFDPHRPLAPRGLRRRALAVDSARVLAHAALPASWSARLPRPALRTTVGESTGPTERFDAFLARLQNEARTAARQGEPLLVFSHLLLPHHPWLRDASGRLYDAGDEILIAGIKSPQIGAIHAKWQDDWETVLDAYERHVLQTRHADRLVGRLLDLLRSEGLFDRSLIVVAAHHGLHFAPGESLRQRTDDNADSLEQVPLLVKLPGQTEGFVDDSPRSTLDLLPTVLDVLGRKAGNLDLPGSSLLDPPPRAAQPRDEPSFQEVRDRWLERRLAAGPTGFGPWHQQLHGRQLRIGGVPTLDWVAAIDRVEQLENVSPHLPPPRRLSGRLLPRRPEALEELIESERSLPLGVGIDDRMAATSLSTRAREGDEFLEFSLLLPPEAATPGEHQVVLYLLVFDDAGRALEPLPIPRIVQTRPVRGDAEARIAGAARAIRFQGVDAPVEVFGWVPQVDENGAEIETVAVMRGGAQLAKADWVDNEASLGYRYRFDGAPEGARLFRAVVPTPDDLRIIARTGEGRLLELALVATDESVFRVTGPFGLRFDARKPPPAYQNY